METSLGGGTFLCFAARAVATNGGFLPSFLWGRGVKLIFTGEPHQHHSCLQKAECDFNSLAVWE